MNHLDFYINDLNTFPFNACDFIAVNSIKNQDATTFVKQFLFA